MLLKLYEKNNNPQDLQQVVDILNDGGSSSTPLIPCMPSVVMG